MTAPRIFRYYFVNGKQNFVTIAVAGFYYFVAKLFFLRKPVTQ